MLHSHISSDSTSCFLLNSTAASRIRKKFPFNALLPRSEKIHKNSTKLLIYDHFDDYVSVLAHAKHVTIDAVPGFSPAIVHLTCRVSVRGNCLINRRLFEKLQQFVLETGFPMLKFLSYKAPNLKFWSFRDFNTFYFEFLENELKFQFRNCFASKTF